MFGVEYPGTGPAEVSMSWIVKSASVTVSEAPEGKLYPSVPHSTPVPTFRHLEPSGKIKDEEEKNKKRKQKQKTHKTITAADSWTRVSISVAFL